MVCFWRSSFRRPVTTVYSRVLLLFPWQPAYYLIRHGIRNISSGFRIIIITLIIAGIAAYFFPVKEDEYDELEEVAN